MKKKALNSFHEFKTALISLFDRCDARLKKCLQHGQPFGVCLVHPKHANVGPPSSKLIDQIKNLATKHFGTLGAKGYYLRYARPPMLPILKNKLISPSIDDYGIIFQLPQFDGEWQKSKLARDLIYCPSNEEFGGDIDWFEIQLEAIRLTPLLHQALEEAKILTAIYEDLEQPGFLRFEAFIYEYAINDHHFPAMNQHELEKWKNKELDWKIRYHLITGLFPSTATLRDFYVISRKKATSSRNPMIKDLLREFISMVENELISNTSLPEEMKKRELSQLRAHRQRQVKKEKYSAKRPATCISDIECAAVLYYLCTQFLEKKRKSIVLGEGILFIWLAQHSAFSGLHLKVDDFFAIKVSDIDFQSLVIRVNEQEIFPTQGVMDILAAWISSSKLNKSDQLFKKINYDNLEELLSKKNAESFGIEHKLLPKDFLEKVHVIPGTLISLELRREITKQEELIKNSPYRINSQKIKEEIKKAVKQQAASMHTQ